MRIFLSAGETSGDLLGAHLVRDLHALDPDLEAVGLGGPRMAEAGQDAFYDLTEHAIMGILPVLRHLPTLRRLVAEVGRRFDEDPPDAFVPIDYPGLHFVLAKMAKRRGIPVIYYVSPQLWAWGSFRVAKVRRRVDRLLAILPFEEEFFRSRGVDATYVGHPLVDRLDALVVDDAVARAITGDGAGTSEDPPVLGLLPGSRLQEVRTLFPVMLDVARRIAARAPRPRIVVPFAPEASARGRLMRELLDATPVPGLVRVGDHPHVVMKLARTCLVASGTATAELAYLGTPMVILYRVSPFARALARWIVRVPHIGMANILAGRRAVPEFLFSTPPLDRIEARTHELLFDPERQREVRSALAEVRRTLGPPGASGRAAREILAYLGRTDAENPHAEGSRAGGSRNGP